MKNGCENQICPILKLMGIISKKWVLLIIKSIHEGCVSYSDIEKSLDGVNPRILCSRLIELQEYGFIDKKVISKTPLKSVYCLTEKGESFSKNIDTMIEWSKKWM